MTLDEAIEHAAQIADSYKDTVPDCECAKEHRQLAKWLTELKMARVCAFAEIPQMAQTINENRELKAENERLRQELAIREESEQEKTIESLRQENVDWEDKYRALAFDNAKLRELVGMMSKAIGVSATTCYGDCIAPYECSFNGGCPIQKLMRELGVEVSDD